MDNLWNDVKVLQELYIHMIFGEGDKFRKTFINQATVELNNNDVFYSLIDGEKCKEIKGLFEEFKTKLKFPEYFGENWAAFDDCLNDLDWLGHKKIILFFNDFDKILSGNEEEFKVFVDILISTMHEWISGRDYDSFPTPPTPFHLVINCKDENEENLEEMFNEAEIGKINKMHL